MAFFKIRKFSLSEGELLTADIEDDYDALNDETFGGAGGQDTESVGEDWEEGHEKYAEFVTHGRGLLNNTQPSSSFKPFFDEDDEDLDDHLTDLDDSNKAKWHTKDIVVQSLSQLGLEDDLDESSLTSYRRSSEPRQFQSLFGSAPPALLHAEECGSPKTRSIWSSDHVYSSTPTQDDKLSSLLKSLQGVPTSQVKVNGSVFQGPQVPLPPPSFLPNAHRLEDVERNLLNQPPKPSEITCSWDSPKTIRAEQLEEELLGGAPHKTLGRLGISSQPSPISSRGWSMSEPAQGGYWATSSPPLPRAAHTLDEIEKDMLSKVQAPTVEEVERFLQGASPSSSALPRRIPNMDAPIVINGPHHHHQPPIGTPPQGSPLMSMLNPSNMSNSSGLGPFNGGRSSPHIGSQPPSNVLPPHPILNPSRHQLPQFIVPPRLPNNIPRMHFMPNHGSPRPPNFYNANLERLLYSRPIHHPLLNIQWPQQGRFPGQPLPPDMGYSRGGGYRDEYEGLMNPREKEWLIKIQMLQLHSDNPYVDDYYFTKFNMRKITMQQKKKSSGEQVKLMLPERVKHESKTYVPVQFEGSLGKLQVISVNFPRKVLDVHSIAGEDENSRNPANMELHKQRKLLLDIEKLYTVLLDIDDEEKMMCALPKESHVPHKENREKLLDTLFEGLCCSSDVSPLDDTFLRMACIRKGRHLLLRALALFHKERQRELLRCFCHHLGPIMRRDKVEQVTEQYLEDTIIPVIHSMDMCYLLVLARALCHNLAPDTPVKDSALFVAGLYTRIGFSLLCIMFNKAEMLHKEGSDVKNDIQTEWADLTNLLIKGMVLHGGLGLPEVDIDARSFWMHLQRLGVQENQIDSLKSKRTLVALSDSNGNSVPSH